MRFDESDLCPDCECGYKNLYIENIIKRYAKN